MRSTQVFPSQYPSSVSSGISSYSTSPSPPTLAIPEPLMENYVLDTDNWTVPSCSNLAGPPHQVPSIINVTLAFKHTHSPSTSSPPVHIIDLDQTNSSQRLDLVLGPSVDSYPSLSFFSRELSPISGYLSVHHFYRNQELVYTDAPQKINLSNAFPLSPATEFAPQFWQEVFDGEIYELVIFFSGSHRHRGFF